MYCYDSLIFYIQVVRGDVPHFCNFVRPCSVYDKLTGERVSDTTSAQLSSFLDEFSSLYNQVSQ